ncbi:hypothetical protein [Enterobacter hormaechei]|uniref:hypothetical protein n=1 Tax=Enterobacter hormaechei TaxID=158836 RepID=UPI002A756338|nr:hypothetical protein [Enterobacter hormaechei]MDY3572498.1 hypothetical protein [Enterobacter hormaechei]
MKTLTLILAAILLSGCSATMVSYQGNTAGTNCPPLVSVHSSGNTVTVSDGSPGKVITE